MYLCGCVCMHVRACSREKQREVYRHTDKLELAGEEQEGREGRDGKWESEGWPVNTDRQTQVRALPLSSPHSSCGLAFLFLPTSRRGTAERRQRKAPRCLPPCPPPPPPRRLASHAGPVLLHNGQVTSAFGLAGDRGGCRELGRHWALGNAASSLWPEDGAFRQTVLTFSCTRRLFGLEKPVLINVLVLSFIVQTGREHDGGPDPQSTYGFLLAEGRRTGHWLQVLTFSLSSDTSYVHLNPPGGGPGPQKHPLAHSHPHRQRICAQCRGLRIHQGNLQFKCISANGI